MTFKPEVFEVEKLNLHTLFDTLFLKTPCHSSSCSSYNIIKRMNDSDGDSTILGTFLALQMFFTTLSKAPNT